MVENTNNGTRDWTRAEKQELLERGRVKGYEEHHINSVNGHPEQAGNPDNVEFVKRTEHLQRHGGDFRNSTEGQLVNRKAIK